MLAICFGTRPEYLKILPIVQFLRTKNIEFQLIYIQQHTDLFSETIFYDRTVYIDDHYSDNRLNNIVCSILERSEMTLEGIDWVMVQGDTTSAFGMALAAFQRGIRVIHVEAGLRTHDKKNPYPEETNRQLISRIADLHFAPTWENEKNLFSEGINHENIKRTGNTLFDFVKYPSITFTNHVLITMHRAEKSKEEISQWIDEYINLANKLEWLKFTWVLHPRIYDQVYDKYYSNENKPKNLELILPIEHKELLKLMAKSKFIITDSGGIQEECSFLKKKCIVTRKVTERPETLEDTSFLCPEPKSLCDLAKVIDDNPFVRDDYKCPYTFGQGVATTLIYDELKRRNII